MFELVVFLAEAFGWLLVLANIETIRMISNAEQWVDDKVDEVAHRQIDVNFVRKNAGRLTQGVGWLLIIGALLFAGIPKVILVSFWGLGCAVACRWAYHNLKNFLKW